MKALINGLTAEPMSPQVESHHPVASVELKTASLENTASPGFVDNGFMFSPQSAMQVPGSELKSLKTEANLPKDIKMFLERAADGKGVGIPVWASGKTEYVNAWVVLAEILKKDLEYYQRYIYNNTSIPLEAPTLIGTVFKEQSIGKPTTDKFGNLVDHKVKAELNIFRPLVDLYKKLDEPLLIIKKFDGAASREIDGQEAREMLEELIFTKAKILGWLNILSHLVEVNEALGQEIDVMLEKADTLYDEMVFSSDETILNEFRNYRLSQNSKSVSIDAGEIYQVDETALTSGLSGSAKTCETNQSYLTDLDMASGEMLQQETTSKKRKSNSDIRAHRSASRASIIGHDKLTSEGCLTRGKKRKVQNDKIVEDYRNIESLMGDLQETSVRYPLCVAVDPAKKVTNKKKAKKKSTYDNTINAMCRRRDLPGVYYASPSCQALLQIKELNGKPYALITEEGIKDIKRPGAFSFEDLSGAFDHTLEEVAKP